MLVYMHEGAQHVIYGQGQNNCIPKALQTNILLYCFRNAIILYICLNALGMQLFWPCP